MTIMSSSFDEASTISSALAESSRAGKSLMARCRILQLSMLQPHTGYSKLSVVVVVACREKCNYCTAGLVCTAMWSSCCGQTCENSTPINAVTISDTFNCAIITE